jgi:hypothetical protein
MQLHGYDKADINRIKAIASQIVSAQIERGEIPLTDEAIRAAMPEAIETAREAVSAVNEFLCG